ncbi:MAG: PIN domain-containing protein [Woeseiaceae bacterium]
MNGTDCFFDTNVLLYLLSADASKADTVERLLEVSGSISLQVLNEFTAVGKGKLGLSFAEISDVTGTIRAICSVHPLTEETYDRGVRIAGNYGFRVYDSMIVAAALTAGCDTLYSEDLQHRQLIDDRLTVVNPFHS